MADESTTHTGGCLCGTVHYEGEEVLGAAYCHCRMCQKWVGNAFALCAQFSRKTFRITQGEPRWHRSSEILERGFCSDCGTPLLGRYLIPAFSDWLLVTVGSLDHPERTPPQRHFGIESQLPWLAIHDDLPRERYQESFIESQADEAKSNPSGAPEGWRWGDGMS